MKKRLYIITPTYNYHERKDRLHKTIEYLTNQKPHGLEVIHLVVFDGPGPDTLPIETPNWYRIEVMHTERTAKLGAHQRNTGIQRAREDGWVWFVDDDNPVESDALAKIERALAPEIGMILFQVFEENVGYAIPHDLEHAPKYLETDTMSMVINADIAWRAEWQTMYGHDFFYGQNIWSIAEHFGFKNKIVLEILGSHK